MKSLKVFILDLAMRNQEHVFFNSAMIKILNHNFNGYSKHFWGERKHILNLKKEGLDINYKDIFLLRTNGLKYVLSDILSIFWVLNVLFFSKKGDVIFFLNRLPLSLLVYNFLNLFFRRKTFSVCHGELEALVNPHTSRSCWKCYLKYILNVAYFFSSNKMKYVILGESIKRNLSSVNFGKASLITIDHPYCYDYPKQKIRNHEHITIGIIGSASKLKRSECFFELANLLSKETKFTFRIVGPVDPSLYYCNTKNVDFQKSNNRLSQEQYYKEIESIDYAVSFYDSHSIKALASGSFFDCIKFAKPILAISGNSFVDYYFEALGNIGFRFLSVIDMAEYMKSSQFLLDYRIMYKEQICALLRAQEVLSITNIAKQFAKQL